MKKVFLLVLVMVMAGGGIVYLRRDRQTITVFRTAPVERGNLVVTISATGTVEPEEVIDVGAQVAGQILAFGQDIDGKTVDYGSRVEAGTVLARIDDALYTSEVTQAEAQVLSAQGGLQRAEADLEQLKVKLEQAEQDWRRAESLGKMSTALAATDYDNFKAAYHAARAAVAVGEAAIIQAKGNLAQAQGMLDRANRNLGYTTIVSPVKGVIIDRRVNIGQTVVASLNAPSLFLIAKDLTRMQVWVAVNEADIGRLRPGQPVTFTVDAFPDETFVGQVGKIRLNASMTQNVVTYTVEVVTDNSSGRLLPYLTANVKFEIDRRNDVLMVPNAALTWTPAVEKISPAHRDAYAQPVAAGTRSDKTTSETSGASGDEPGHRVIWTVDGQYVRPIRVRVGLTDDAMTEVQGEELIEGMRIVTGEEQQTQSSAAGGSNPFLPKPPRPPKGGPHPPM